MLGQPCHPDQQRSIGALKPEAMPCLPQRDIELVPQIQVLDFKAARRLNRLETSATNSCIKANIVKQNALIPP